MLNPRKLSHFIPVTAFLAMVSIVPMKATLDALITTRGGFNGALAFVSLICIGYFSSRWARWVNGDGVFNTWLRISANLYAMLKYAWGMEEILISEINSYRNRDKDTNLPPIEHADYSEELKRRCPNLIALLERTMEKLNEDGINHDQGGVS